MTDQARDKVSTNGKGLKCSLLGHYPTSHLKSDSLENKEVQTCSLVSLDMCHSADKAGTLFFWRVGVSDNLLRGSFPLRALEHGCHSINDQQVHNELYHSRLNIGTM